MPKSAFESRPTRRQVRRPWAYALLSVAVSLIALLGLMTLATNSPAAAQREVEPQAPAAPIPPPEGYPKFNQSTKSVTPTVAEIGGTTLTYIIEICNTGATTATQTSLVDTLPTGVSYNGDGPFQTVTSQTLVWTGTVGFDATVIISFSVDVAPGFTGTLLNTAVISDPAATKPVTLTAETVVTDEPILVVEKNSSPAKPGANKPLFYELKVTNRGQPAINLPISVTDQLPADTTFRSVGPDGTLDGDTVRWTRQVSLELGQSAYFTFSVDVDGVPSGTVIANENYGVAWPSGAAAGVPYTVTVIDPIFLLSKGVWPDPPGSNREMTYTLRLFNVGSLATGLVITDRVPDGVTYVRGGSSANLPFVRWELPSLDTGESAEFQFTVHISDVMKVPVVNANYWVCSAEGVCVQGDPLTSVVQGPTFEAYVMLNPIAKKPGGGGGPVTPTLVVRNLGPGNAIDAQATITFGRISVSANDLYAIPPIGTPPPFPPGPDCGDKCVSYVWVGSLGYGDVVTFTTIEGQSTIGGAEGTHYTATVVITDELENMSTKPVTGQATGMVTHYANLIPMKTAPKVIGRGELLTYTIQVWNSALSTDEPPYPYLWDFVPMSTTLVSISDGGVALEMTGTLQGTVISWTLPGMSPGDRLERSFTVRVDDDVVSGTQILNDDYRTYWYEPEAGEVFSNTGKPVTTTVQEVGLIDSYKTVTPVLSRPGPGNLLTYHVHLVNSSGFELNNVTAYDVLPWQASTYQRDAVASAGVLVSDIVSIDWRGSIEPNSEVVITATVLVDADFEGVLTNTVLISHPDLLAPVERHAVAYVTNDPVLFIRKTATPSPVELDELLTYQIRVTNLGQQATELVITDVLPSNVIYAGGGSLDGDTVSWEWPGLDPGEQVNFSFQVTVTEGVEVVNALYSVRCAEGVVAFGAPVITPIRGAGSRVLLPIVIKGGL